MFGNVFSEQDFALSGSLTAKENVTYKLISRKSCKSHTQNTFIQIMTSLSYVINLRIIATSKSIQCAHNSRNRTRYFIQRRKFSLKIDFSLRVSASISFKFFMLIKLIRINVFDKIY